MDNEYIEQLAHKYQLPKDFLMSFYGKVTDKQNFEFGIKMFVDGLITYDVATGAQPIDISEHQKKYLSTIPGK